MSDMTSEKKTTVAPKVEKPKRSNGCTSYRKFPNFKQFDKEWKDDKMAAGKKLEEAGALTTVFAMILNAEGKQLNGKETVTPKSLNEWLIKNGGYNKNGGLTKQWISKIGLKKNCNRKTT